MSSTGMDKKRLISMVEAEELYGLSHDYLARLTCKGRLKEQKIGGIWVTTPADAADVRCGRFCYNFSYEG